MPTERPAAWTDRLCSHLGHGRAWRSRSFTLMIAALLFVLTGCQSEAANNEERPTLLVGVPMNGGTDVLISGTVSEVHGCVGLSSEAVSFPVVWPYGTEYASSEGTSIRLPDGRILEMGDEFAGGGGFEAPDSSLVPQEIPDECLGNEVAVLNEDQEQ